LNPELYDKLEQTDLKPPIQVKAAFEKEKK